MIKICFVCLGNICRSPMAEYIMKKKIKDLNLQNEFLIASRATSYEEEGNDIYPLAKDKLTEKQIPYKKHRSTRLEKEDYPQYDYFICMEDRNVRNSKLILGEDPSKKIVKLLKKDIADPWYTGNFTETYNELDLGIEEFLKKILINQEHNRKK